MTAKTEKGGNGSFTIEKNIPMPTRSIRPEQEDFSFIKMQVGDSFLIKTPDRVTPDETKKYQEASRSKVLSRARIFRQTNKQGFKISTRLTGSDVRVWRVA